MMDATLRIKNLSIALEALSRIPDSGQFTYDIEKLLKVEIKVLQEENQKATEAVRPAKSTTDKDDIPF